MFVLKNNSASIAKIIDRIVDLLMVDDLLTLDLAEFVPTDPEASRLDVAVFEQKGIPLS